MSREYNEINKEEIKSHYININMHYINIAYINREAYERNDTETIVNNGGILWLKEKHIEEGLHHKNL